MSLEIELSKNQFFEGVEPELLTSLIPDLIQEDFAAQEIIFSEGDPGDCLYLVLEGIVSISKEGRGGKQEQLSAITVGGFMGEMALFDNEPRSARATATEPCRLVRMSTASLTRAIQIAPDRITQNFIRSVIQRLRRSNHFFIEQLLLSERMSIVGTMAGSIIHDFKNPMSAIVCACDFLRQTGQDPLIHQMTGIIQKSVDRMLVMTQELLDFSKGQASLQIKKAVFSKLLTEIEEQFLPNMEAEKITYQKVIHGDWEIELDQARFERLLLNIIKNAREAMPDGGKLDIDASADGDFLVLTIADSGCGMPPSVRERIFEPFVTHGKSNGTGLGMAIVKNMIDAHRGQISVTSEEGQGTCFTIRVPFKQPTDATGLVL